MRSVCPAQRDPAGDLECVLAVDEVKHVAVSRHDRGLARRQAHHTEARPRHGYELSKLIHMRSGGQLTFHIDSLYPLLYRLGERGWIAGKWIEKPEERRRRFYKVTPEGRRVLAHQRKTWAAFVEAVRRVTGDEHA